LATPALEEDELFQKNFNNMKSVVKSPKKKVFFKNIFLKNVTIFLA